MASMGSPSFKLILGSSSSSRKLILSDMGYDFPIMTADIDEKQIRRENPEELVMALAEAKADAIMAKLQMNEFREKDEPTLLITADQVVVHGAKIREKPSSREEAREFIQGYSEGHAATVGSVLVTNLKTGVRKGGWDKAELDSKNIRLETRSPHEKYTFTKYLRMLLKTWLMKAKCFMLLAAYWSSIR